MQNTWPYVFSVLLANYLHIAVPISLLLVIINWSMFSPEYFYSFSHLFNLTRENAFKIHDTEMDWIAEDTFYNWIL